MPAKKRAFGSVRRLSSGRWQARYPGPDGLMRPAPHTFERKKDAEIFLDEVRTDMRRDAWVDPARGSVLLHDYARTWLDERPDLSATTRERYDSALRRQVLPNLGECSIADIKEATVRRWRKKLLDDGHGAPSVAKAYRLLRAIMNTAVDDGLIRRNPCRIKGAGDDKTPERPVLSLSEVFKVAEAAPTRYRALVLLAAFSSLRFGELAALRRRDVDLDSGTVAVTQGQIELANGQLVTKGPKSEAGKRRVSVPAAILPALRAHLSEFAEPGPNGRVFIGPSGGYLRRQNFRRIWRATLVRAGLLGQVLKIGDRTWHACWTDEEGQDRREAFLTESAAVAHVVREAGEGVHFHDLRHTGNTLAAATGASLRELMTRMGHASTRAAVIYQHATSERDRAIADALNARIVAEQRAGSESGRDMAASRSGT